MDKKLILESIQKVRKNSPKRNFAQTFDLIINLKNLDLKKSDQSINSFITLPNPIGKKIKICGLVDKELASKSKENFDNTTLADDFEKLNEKDIKKLAKEFDFFVAQATIMAKIATTFGKILGPLGKMPNPNAGCIVPPVANLKTLKEKLQKTINLKTKNEQIIKCPVGKQDMQDEEIADNILTIYNSLVSQLPQEKTNIKSILLKLTMSPITKITKEKNEKKNS